MMREGKGVTLIEVMVVVAIVGLLAAIAIPAYDNYITRSRRSDAFTALETVRAAQEMYRAEHGGYAVSFAALAGCSAGMAGDNYLLSLQNIVDADGNFLDDDNLYQIQAQAQNKQINDYWFRLDQDGNQSYSSDSGGAWKSDKKFEDLR
jgi:type IV pilus assembly protein PilE